MRRDDDDAVEQEEVNVGSLFDEKDMEGVGQQWDNSELESFK